MILVVVEHDAGTVDRLSAEALTLGRSLAEATKEPLEAVAWGPDAAGLAGALGAGVATLHVLDDGRFTEHAPEAAGKALGQLLERITPSAVVAPASDRSSEVMAHVAARTNLPLAANCIEVRAESPWAVTRQRWGGSLLEVATLEGSTRLLTAAPHAFEPAPVETGAGAAVNVVPFVPELTDRDFRVRVTSRVPAEAGKVSLADARVVVSGGRGVGSAEGFAQLDELAALLGGAVGVSRVVTSAGWRPHAQQVGQTGTRVAPDLYIACGISGAIQHIVGMRSAKNVLAINTDRDAPMVTRATWAVIGDLHAILPAIIDAVKAAR